jgi:Tfp pilus assembly protein PilN
VFALVIALVGVGLNCWLNYQAKQRLLTDLMQKEPKVQELRNLVAEDEILREEADFYRGNWERTRQILVFFNLWAETVPEGTILTSVILEEEQITQLSGRTRSFSRLYAALLASPSFHQLQLKGEITINRDGDEGFTLTGKWNEPNEAGD